MSVNRKQQIVLGAASAVVLAALGLGCYSDRDRAFEGNRAPRQERAWGRTRPAGPSEFETFGAWCERNYPDKAGRRVPRSFLENAFQWYLREQDAKRWMHQKQMDERAMRVREAQLELQREEVDLERKRLGVEPESLDTLKSGDEAVQPQGEAKPPDIER